MMNKDRPYTTLFMIMSVDGKISTGDSDHRDVDKDFPLIKGVSDGLKQYYDLEKKTDLYSFNTGRVMAKIGVNTRTQEPKKMPVSFIIIDNKPHLDKKGVAYLGKWVKKLYLVTTTKNHPAAEMKLDNLELIYCPDNINFSTLFKRFKKKYSIERITIQSGGKMNATLLRKDLIDSLSLVVAPCLIGGKNTSTLIDGTSLRTQQDLKHVKSLKLKNCEVLKNSYLHLKYDIIRK